MSHPSARLVSWLIVIVGLQYLEWPALLCLAAVVALSGGDVRSRWLRLVRRARWLLLTLWAVLAYGTPGDAWQGLSWAPTEAGIYEASLHAGRLVVMLGALGWLFHFLPTDRLMAGLWEIIRPLRRFGIDTDRGVVRLALVFDYLEKAPPKGSWRQLLDESRHLVGGPDVVRMELPAWHPADGWGILVVALVMGLGVFLP